MSESPEPSELLTHRLGVLGILIILLLEARMKMDAGWEGFSL